MPSRLDEIAARETAPLYGAYLPDAEQAVPLTPEERDWLVAAVRELEQIATFDYAFPGCVGECMEGVQSAAKQALRPLLRDSNEAD